MQHSVPHVLPPCKHEANKNVVEARLKGTGMHWQRTHVNPMLALRNAICNDRWQEMWKKALKHHRKLHTLQRSVRVKPGAPSVLAVGTSSSVESPPPSAATSKPLSSPAHSLGAQPSSSCRPSTVGKRQRANHRVNSSPHDQVREAETLASVERLWRASRGTGPNSIVLIGVASTPTESSTHRRSRSPAPLVLQLRSGGKERLCSG